MQEIRRISVTDEVVNTIKAMIENGDYKIDQKLPTENELCRIMKVSRTSVREAIRALQALGYVKIIPGKGAFADDYEAAKMQRANWYDSEDAKFYDYIEVRMAVEVFSVKLAVQLATDEQLHNLTQIHNLFAEAHKQKDLVRMLMLDELFHEKIIAYTKNPLLININRQLAEQYRIYRGDSVTGPAQFYNALKGHSAILQAMLDRDRIAAARAMQEHLESIVKDLPASKHVSN